MSAHADAITGDLRRGRHAGSALVSCSLTAVAPREPMGWRRVSRISLGSRAARQARPVVVVTPRHAERPRSALLGRCS